MKKRIFPALMFALLLVLASCQTSEELSAGDVFDFKQDNWIRCPVTDSDVGKQITAPKSYIGNTYQETLEIALSNIDDPYYELVWGEPTVISPNGEYVVYISNKTDLVTGAFSFMLLKISSNQESVLFNLDHDPMPAYPLWWIDNIRFVYEYNGDYYICSVDSPTEQIAISLKGEKPVILAYDRSFLLYVENADNIGNGTRQIAVINANNQSETIAEFTEEQGILMRESAISEKLHLAVMKGRLTADTDERYIRIYDFARDKSAELLSPLIDGAEQINAVDFYWQGTDFVVRYNVDGIGQKWMYHFN